jgi:NADH-quinone oxidoreductase subunit L
VGITAFYMFRLLFLTFHGKTRLPRGRRGDLDDPEETMMWPLYILAVLAIFGGVLGMPQFWGDLMEVAESDSLGLFLASVLSVRESHALDGAVVGQLVALTLAFSAAGFGLAYLLYISRPQQLEKFARVLSFPSQLLARRFWVDEVYDALIVRPLVAFSDRVLYRGIDENLIDRRLVEGTALGVQGLAAHFLKHVQSGLTQAYLLMVVAGTVAVLAYLVG